jgi:hypothetical protein
MRKRPDLQLRTTQVVDSESDIVKCYKGKLDQMKVTCATAVVSNLYLLL